MKVSRRTNKRTCINPETEIYNLKTISTKIQRLTICLCRINFQVLQELVRLTHFHSNHCKIEIREALAKENFRDWKRDFLIPETISLTEQQGPALDQSLPEFFQSTYFLEVIYNFRVEKNYQKQIQGCLRINCIVPGNQAYRVATCKNPILYGISPVIWL